ncbi:GntR family transcriptional regulator [Actinocatenispora sera]|uniref:GntR family transcriptional regulator n=1 Tax=Actinocatenispora sera TaxID=390989 RepID=UPI0033F465D4
MPLEVSPPKYAQVLAALQAKIESGTYAPGSALPSEAKLSAEYDTSRTTIVKALSILRQDGWIESHQGKSHFVRGVPASARQVTPEYVSSALDLDESVGTELLRVGAVIAPRWVAMALGVDSDTPVYERRRLLTSNDGPVALSTVYIPVELAVGNDLTKREPIAGGIRGHLRKSAGVRLDSATTRITARLPEPAELDLLKVTETTPVLWLMVTASAPDGAVVAAVDTVLPADRHDLVDTFPLAD